MPDNKPIKPLFAGAHGQADPKAFLADIAKLSGRFVLADVDPAAYRYQASAWQTAFPMSPVQLVETLTTNLPGETRVVIDDGFRKLSVEGFVKKSLKSGKKPCYYTTLSFEGQNDLHINEIFVNPNLRGQGIGGALQSVIGRVAQMREAQDITLVAGWSDGAASWAQAGAVLNRDADPDQHDDSMNVLQKRIVGLLESGVLTESAQEEVERASLKIDENTLQRIVALRTDVSALTKPGAALMDSHGTFANAYDPLDCATITLSEAVNIARMPDGRVPLGPLLLAETYWPCRLRLKDEGIAQRFRGPEAGI